MQSLLVDLRYIEDVSPYRTGCLNRQVASADIRPARINQLLHATQLNGDYLEIGVAEAKTLLLVNSQVRVGVDPHPRFDPQALPDGTIFFRTESDKFFETEAERFRFALSYIDGLHQWRQAYRDVLNSLNYLLPGGVLVIDDVLPRDWYSSQPEPQVVAAARTEGLIEHGCWYGDVYKVLLVIQKAHSELDFVTIGGHPPKRHAQAIVWRRSRQEHRYDSLALSAEHNHQDIDALAYGDVFVQKSIPSNLQPRKESIRLFNRIARVAQ